MKIIITIFLFISITTNAQLVQDSTIDQTHTLNSILKYGGNITIPDGTYLCYHLNMVSNTFLFGAHVKFKMAPGHDYSKMLDLWVLHDVTIKGIEIDMKNAIGSIANGSPAIDIWGCHNVKVLNCYIHDNKYIAVRLGGKGNDSIYVQNNVMHNTDTGILCSNLNTNLFFTGNTITGGTSEGITIAVYDNDSTLCPHNILIDSNFITGKANSWGISLPFAKSVRVTRNVIRNCRAAMGMHNFKDDVPNDSFYTANVTIEGNTFINNNRQEVERLSQTRNVTVTNNKVISYTQQPLKAKALPGKVGH